MRARLAIAQNDIAVELREVLLRDKPEHMIELSAKATVPVLWLADGSVIDESLDIMRWAFGSRAFRAHQEPDFDLIGAFDTRFKHHLDRYKYAARYDPDAALEHRDAALAMLRDLKPRLQGDWLSGEEPRFTDLALLPFIRQYRIADIAWFDGVEGIEAVQQWLSRFLQWQGFQDVMQKYPQWRTGQPGVRFAGKPSDAGGCAS